MNAPARIAELERQLHWAQLKIQVLEEELRQRRIQQLGPKSETLSNLQLALLTEEEPSTTRDEVEGEARRERLTRTPPRERDSPGVPGAAARVVAEELSNNLAENSMRPVALGRKNWLHVGSAQAGPKVAAILSVVESCRQLGVPVKKYLSAILPGLCRRKLPEVRLLTPSRWATSRSIEELTLKYL